MCGVMKRVALLFMVCVLLILLTDNSLENVYSKHSSIPSRLANLAPYQGFQKLWGESGFPGSVLASYSGSRETNSGGQVPLTARNQGGL